MTLMTLLLQGLLLDQAKTRRDDLQSLLEGEVQTGLSGLDWKDVCRLLHRELGVRQEAVHILRLMLVHWCNPGGRFIPLANIFKLLRLVTIRHGMPKQVVRNIAVSPKQELNIGNRAGHRFVLFEFVRISSRLSSNYRQFTRSAKPVAHLVKGP